MTDKDASPYGAFAVLCDGEQHHVDELKERCGDCGARRARDLRSAKYGGWDVQCERVGNDTFYWIEPDELARKRRAADCLRCRSPVEIIDPVDEVKVAKLSVMDIVFLIALIQNDSQLKHIEVMRLWEHRRDVLAGQLRALLPDDIRFPFDLFEEQ